MSPKTLRRIHERPENQVWDFLNWMEEGGVRRFDIQLRVPSLRGGDDPWMWLTRQHQDIDAKGVMGIWPWLRFMNAQGADVFFRPARQHEHPILFMDDLPLSRAIKVAEKYGAAVILTSPGNTQVWMRTSRALGREERGQAQKHLNGLGWTDPGSTSGDHLGRLCGLVSQKRQCWVNAVHFSCAPPCSVDSWSSRPHAPECPRGGASSRGASPDSSSSEKEFGAQGLLRSGVDETVVKQRILEASKSRGKRNPDGYAERTVREAIRLIEGR